jgi:hypothetical protein
MVAQLSFIAQTVEIPLYALLILMLLPYDFMAELAKKLINEKLGKNET